MFITKKELDHIYTRIEECEEKIKKQNNINNKIFEITKDFQENLTNLTKIVYNQPLIKKYQKTLDLMLRNK